MLFRLLAAKQLDKESSSLNLPMPTPAHATKDQPGKDLPAPARLSQNQDPVAGDDKIHSPVERHDENPVYEPEAPHRPVSGESVNDVHAERFVNEANSDVGDKSKSSAAKTKVIPLFFFLGRGGIQSVNRKYVSSFFIVLPIMLVFVYWKCINCSPILLTN